MTQKYSKYKDSGIEWIGEIPEHWEVIPNKYIFKQKKNLVGKNSNAYELLSLTLRGIIKRDMENPEGKFPAEFDNYQEVNRGDFIFCLFDVEETPRTVGLSNYDGMITGAYTVLENFHGSNSKYLYYFYLYADENKLLKYLYRGLRNTIPKESFFSFNTPLPPLPEQEAIAQFLDEKCARIDEAVRIKEKQIDLLKEYRQIAIHQAVTKGLNDQVKMKDSGIDWIGEIPEHWEVIPLNYIGFTQNGISKGGEYFGKGTPFISYSDVHKNETLPRHINGLVEATSNEMLQYSVEKGDVFFTRTSETVDEIGLSSVALENFENATFAGFLIRFRFTKNIYLPEFSKYYFRSKTHRPFFVGKMNLVIRASLSQELLKKMPVLIPPLAEQTQIIEHLESLMAKTDEAIHLKKKQIEQLKQYKNTLINEVVTGKIRVS